MTKSKKNIIEQLDDANRKIKELEAEKEALENYASRKNAHLKLILDNAPIILSYINKEGIIELSEGKALERMHLKTGELVGSSIYEAFPSGEAFHGLFQEAISGKEVTKRIVAKDNLHFHNFLAPDFSESGEVEGVTNVVVDLTESGKLEKINIGKEQQFAYFFEHLPASVVMFDQEMRIIRASKQWCVDNDLNPNTIYGKSQFDIFPKESRFWEKIQATCLQGESLKKECEIVVRDGDTIYFDWLAKPWYDYNQQIGGIVVFTQETTEKVNTNEDLRKHKELLEKKLADLELFACATYHDLREPLRPIISFVQLLERKYKNIFDEEGKEFLHHIVSNAKRMHQLVTGLLAYVDREENHKKECIIDPNSIINDFKDNLAKKFPAKKVNIRISDLPKIKVPGQKAKVLITHLLKNAVQFNENNIVNIDIDIKKEEDFHTFSIGDNGIGIAPKYHQSIFKLFTQLSANSKYKGGGIGLSVCKKMVEDWGGRIWVDSKEGDGSKFFFTIPENMVAV